MRILPYPCHVSAADEAQPPPFVAFQAHPAHVTAVAWTADSSKLLTAGSPDLTVKQWAVERARPPGQSTTPRRFPPPVCRPLPLSIF